jgi:hypothetical protein
MTASVTPAGASSTSRRRGRTAIHAPLGRTELALRVGEPAAESPSQAEPGANPQPQSAAACASASSQLPMTT